MGQGGAGGVGGVGTGGMGEGGDGGMGGEGQGGSGGAEPATLFALFGAGAGAATHTAWFSENGGWSVTAYPTVYTDAGAATGLQDGSVVLAARQATLDALDDLVLGASYTSGSFSGFSTLGASVFTAGRPALGGYIDTADLFFLGKDSKHYHALFSMGGFGAPGSVPAGNAGVQAFGPSPASTTTDGAASYAAYAGDDAHVYYVGKSSAGGAFSPSAQVPTSLVKNNLPPAVVADGANKLYFFYVRQSDAVICYVTLTFPQVTFGAETAIHANAITQTAVAATLSSTGDIVVAWRGYSDDGVFFSRGNSAGFAAPAAVDQPGQTTTEPVLSKGVGGNDAEVFYVIGSSTVQHGRLMGSAWTLSPVSMGPSATFVAAATLY